MTTTAAKPLRGIRSGFTLIEVLVATSIGSFLLTAVMGTTLYLIRSQIQLTHYAEMDTQLRRAVDRLGNDIKVATGITWNGISDITLTIPDVSGNSSQVTYAWDGESGVLYSVPGGSSTETAGRLILIRNIPALSDGGAGVRFARYDSSGAVAADDVSTKRIQLSITVQKQGNSSLPATSSNGSCSFILRNKGSS